MHKRTHLGFTLCVQWAQHTLLWSNPAAENEIHISQLLVVGLRTRQLECHMRLTMNLTNRWINYGRHSWTEPCMTKQTDETVTNFCHSSMNIPPWEFLWDNKNLQDLLCFISFSFSRQHTITKHVNNTWRINLEFSFISMAVAQLMQVARTTEDFGPQLQKPCN